MIEREPSPARTLLLLLKGHIVVQAIRAAAQLGLADLVKDNPKSLLELAEATNVPARSLARLLRVLVALEIFIEKESGVFAQSELSYLLRSDIPYSMHDLALMHGDEWQWRPWEAFLYSLQTERPAFDSLYGMSLWQYFQQRNPRSGQLFHAAMTSFSNQDNMAIASAYDFSSFHLLVDVGGGEGSLLRTILHTYPTLQGILFDQPTVIEQARELFDREGLAARCTLVPGSFFASIPQQADAYLLKQIIKDWSDQEAITLLQNCRQAMKPQSKLLVVEPALTSEGMLYEKLVDLQLMVVAPARERTAEEYQKLFQEAGFTLLSIRSITPTAAQFSIFECIAS